MALHEEEEDEQKEAVQQEIHSRPLSRTRSGNRNNSNGNQKLDEMIDAVRTEADAHGQPFTYDEAREYVLHEMKKVSVNSNSLKPNKHEQLIQAANDIRENAHANRVQITGPEALNHASNEMKTANSDDHKLDEMIDAVRTEADAHGQPLTYDEAREYVLHMMKHVRNGRSDNQQGDKHDNDHKVNQVRAGSRTRVASPSSKKASSKKKKQKKTASKKKKTHSKKK